MIIGSVNPHIESVMLTVLVQLVVIIVAARLFAWLFRALKQPAVVGEIAAGLLLGPSCFGYFFPETSQQIFDPSVGLVFGVLSQLGLILLLFFIGLEFDFGHLRGRGKAAVAISASGMALPLVLGLILGVLMHPHLEVGPAGQLVSRTGFLLFMGIAMSITAIPVLGRILLELNIARTRSGTMAIAAAAVNDAAGWILLATVSSIVQAEFDPWQSLRMLALTIGFGLFLLVVARPLLKRFAQWAIHRGDGNIGPNCFAAVLVVLFLCSLATNLIGIFAIFGAFLLGTALSDEHEFREALSRQLHNFLIVFLLPIFFTYTGLRTNIGALGTPAHWLMLAGVLFCAIAGKLGGCAASAYFSGFSRRESLCIGAMMNTRGLMELIVINVGRELGVVPDSVYCMLVLMALVTTAMTTPLLLWLMPGTELEPLIRQSGFLPTKRKQPASFPGSRLGTH